MRKILALLLAVTMVIGLTACSVSVKTNSDAIQIVLSKDSATIDGQKAMVLIQMDT